MADGFYVDVSYTGFYDFYYNMVAEVNKNVVKVIEDEVLKRPMTQSAIDYRNNRLAGGLHSKNGPSEFGMMGSMNKSTGQIEYMSALDMQGITASVNREIASEVLELAKFYCPKDTGYLVSTGRMEQNEDGSCRIFFDCPYAFYVHEFSWKNHEYPTCDHFLTRAVEEIGRAHGIIWSNGGSQNG